MLNHVHLYTLLHLKNHSFFMIIFVKSLNCRYIYIHLPDGDCSLLSSNLLYVNLVFMTCFYEVCLTGTTVDIVIYICCKYIIFVFVMSVLLAVFNHFMEGIGQRHFVICCNNFFAFINV